MKKALVIAMGWMLAFSAAWANQQTISQLMEQLQLRQLSDSLKQATNEHIKESLITYLKTHDALRVSVDSIPYMGSVYDADSTLRIISWNYHLQTGKSGCNAIFIKSERKKAPLIHVFSTQQVQLPLEKKRYTPKNWYGALYYRIIKHKQRYLLLGYTMYQPATHVKLIEVLTYEKGKPILGDKIFDIQGKSPYRVVFEYNSMVQMLLRYDSMQKGFIFDHLSPEEPSMEGIKASYGPDFSYDGLFYRKKKWTLVSDLDVKNRE